MVHGVLRFLSLHLRNAECHFPMQKAVIQAVSFLLQLELAHQNLQNASCINTQNFSLHEVVVSTSKPVIFKIITEGKFSL